MGKILLLLMQALILLPLNAHYNQKPLQSSQKHLWSKALLSPNMDRKTHPQ